MNTPIVEVVNVAQEVSWGPWAVQYSFLIGVSVGAFFLTLPGLVFARPAWQRTSRTALLGALLCGLTAPVALLSDLHQPGRAYQFFLHPNLRSWMAWGSFFIPLYVGSLLLFAWLALRPDLLRFAERGGQLAPAALRAAALLACASALLIALYSGAEVMVIQARPLWNTPLLPMQLSVSALAGGIGLVMILQRMLGAANETAAPLNRLLALTQGFTLGLGALWFMLALSGVSQTHALALAQVSSSSSWRITMICAGVTAAMTFVLALRYPKRGLLPGLLALLSAWMIRWVVFIGGQGIPKTGAGYYHYLLPMGADGLLGMIGTAGLWLFLFIVLTTLPPWSRDQRVAA